MLCRRLICLSVFVLSLGTGVASAQSFETPAESGNYQGGGTLYGPLMDFVYELEARSELMNVRTLTTTLAGRDVVLATLSNPPIFRPDDLAHSDKPVVLIVNNVHGGEVAGKDASMEIMRDLVMGDLVPLLDHVVVLVVPTINPDGAEVRRRQNEEGFDMNRDYIKLESQEIHALVTQVINEWHPDIHVDTHHGGSAPYTLTYQTNMNPAGDSILVQFGNQRILARVRQALRAEDYDGFWYTGYGQVDGVRGWVPTSVEPRKQHVFSTLANQVGFLFETPSSSHRVTGNGTTVVPIQRADRYRHQVRGQYIGLRELIRFAAEHGAELRAVVRGARERAIARGHNDRDEDQIPLEYRQVNKGEDRYWVRSDDDDVGFELTTGPVFTRFETTRSTTRPWGYLIPTSLTKVIPLLLDHDITVKRLTEPVTLEVEAYYATAVRTTQYFQAHYLREVDVRKTTEEVAFPTGTFFVPSGQPMSNFISYLLEPETNDNLVTWGYLDNVLQESPTDEDIRRREEEMNRRFPDAGAPQRQFAQRQRERLTNQAIPLYRLMRQTNLRGELVESFNGFARRRYVRP